MYPSEHPPAIIVAGNPPPPPPNPLSECTFIHACLPIAFRSNRFPTAVSWDWRPEAEFLDVIGTKVFRVFLLAIHCYRYKRILLAPPPRHPPKKSGWKLVSSVNIVYVNLNSENSQDYVQKPQRNCKFT